jgi:hypothetical protein
MYTIYAYVYIYIHAYIFIRYKTAELLFCCMAILGGVTTGPWVKPMATHPVIGKTTHTQNGHAAKRRLRELFLCGETLACPRP